MRMSVDRSKPDLTIVVLIHQALRADGARLVATVTSLQPGDQQGRVPGVRAYYDRYREQLIAHHTHEDTVFYPALAAKVGDDRMCRVQLEAEHAQLDDVLTSIGKGLDELAASNGDFSVRRDRVVADLTTMVDELGSHLDFEERVALPLFVSEIPVEEYNALEKKVRRATPRDESSFLIPWLAESATPAQRKAWFRTTPPLAIVYLINRRRYRRVDAALVART